MYHPWRHLRSLFSEGSGVILSFGATPGDKPAWWSPRDDSILMRPDLLQVERRCALAHELAHRDLRHSGHCDYRDASRMDARAEAAADALAARRLIALKEFIDVICWTDDLDEAADALWVTRGLLEARIAGMYGGEQARVRAELIARGHN